MGMPTLFTNNHEEKIIVEFYTARLKDSLQKLSRNGKQCSG